jgi:ABC-type uncharacterized transport system substrate-binding protein
VARLILTRGDSVRRKPNVHGDHPSRLPARGLRHAVAAAGGRRACPLGLRLAILHSSTEQDFEAVFAGLAQRKDPLVIGSDLFFTSHMSQLGALSVRHAVPSIYQFREFAAAGGLMSYGGSITDWAHQAGIHTGRILAGAKPADLPVHQATKLELFINLRTAKALGLDETAPRSRGRTGARSERTGKLPHRRAET